MKAAIFFPLAFIANVHGFILLAPYLVLFLTVVRTLQMYNTILVKVPVKVRVRKD